MPNIKSAEKRVNVNKNKALQNKMIKSDLKTSIKKFEYAVSNNETETAEKMYPEVVKKLDMAAAKGSVHKNLANRKKAKLALRLQATGER